MPAVDPLDITGNARLRLIQGVAAYLALDA
jgi:hypothetical protein